MYDLSFLLSQLFATGTFVCDLISWQCRDRTRVLAVLVVSAVFYALHFALLHAWSGAALAAFSALRFFAARKFPGHNALVAVFVTVTVILTAATYGGYPSLIACMGGVCGTIAAFQREGKRLRLMMMGATTLWLLYNLCLKSPVGTLLEASFLLSNIVGYRRHRKIIVQSCELGIHPR